MKIALIQQSASDDVARNVERGIQTVREAADAGAQLAVFPELAFTRFFPQHRLEGDRMALAESIPGPITETFSAEAAKLGMVIVLNLYERAGDRAYDSSPMIDADGTLLGITRMCHITQYEGFFEQDYYDAGDTGAPVYETAVGRIGVAICYDRHYPEYLRALALGGADLVVIPQAGTIGEWPKGVFEAELQAAAFQNGFYMALANRVGEEDELTFSGESFIVDPRGQIIAQAPSGEDAILFADVELSRVQDSPARLLFLKHRRPEIYVDGGIQAHPNQK
ncbi:MAG: carbon-nitrogen hydrolase family protein [Bacteroidetes bacterium]|nr:MAG: carbon-nitrogen hydrolase family protein [Bacteroidota bacterium]